MAKRKRKRYTSVKKIILTKIEYLSKEIHIIVELLFVQLKIVVLFYRSLNGKRHLLYLIKYIWIGVIPITNQKAKMLCNLVLLTNAFKLIALWSFDIHAHSHHAMIQTRVRRTLKITFMFHLFPVLFNP